MKSQEHVDNLISKVQAELDDLNLLKSEIAADEQAKYDQGWTEAMAQAGSAGSSDKIYSEAEMNQILNEAKAPLEAKIVEQNAALESVPSQLDAAKASGKEEAKSAILGKIDEQNASESASEQSLRDSIASL